MDKLTSNCSNYHFQREIYIQKNNWHGNICDAIMINLQYIQSRWTNRKVFWLILSAVYDNILRESHESF